MFTVPSVNDIFAFFYSCVANDLSHDSVFHYILISILQKDSITKLLGAPV